MSSSPLIVGQSTGPEYPRWSETLRDHSNVLIRPITPRDKDAERAFIEDLSMQARRYRFLGQVRHPSEQMVEQFTNIDQAHEAAFVAVVSDEGRERIVGVSRYSANASGSQCECAVTVSDDWQNRGLGTLLMRHLIEVAQARGIQRMISIDSAENARMQALANYLGFETRVDPDDASQVVHELDL
ncbi:GNAT family N-acetyltransferase [Lysobacter niabensis]|uniref:GNAT family N-acetyltransferase n=1 Tax=Agrilutibacter niabensis TaxID=380628 RepID=UPI003615FFFA